MDGGQLQQEYWEVQVEEGAQRFSPNLSGCSFPDCSFPGKESPTPNVRRISPTAIARPNGCFFVSLFSTACPSLPLPLLTPLNFSRVWHVAYVPGLRFSYLYVCIYTPSTTLVFFADVGRSKTFKTAGGSPEKFKHTHTHTHTRTPEQGDKKREIQMPEGDTRPSHSEAPKSKPPKSVLEEVEAQWAALLDVFGCRDVAETVLFWHD